MRFSAMLPEEYFINSINFTQQRFGLEGTRNISTAESPGR